MFTLYKFRTMIEDAHARREEVAHLNEMNGPVFKAQGRSARDAGRPLAAPLLPRRAPAALERAQGRHEPRRPAPADPGGSGVVPPLAPPPPVDEARPDLPLAGQRPQRHRLRPLDEARPAVHRQLVAVARSEDPAADDSGGVVAAKARASRYRLGSHAEARSDHHRLPRRRVIGSSTGSPTTSTTSTSYPVLSRVQPGDIEKQFADAAESETASRTTSCSRTSSRSSCPASRTGTIRRSSPTSRITGSQAGILGELLSCGDQRERDALEDVAVADGAGDAGTCAGCATRSACRRISSGSSTTRRRSTSSSRWPPRARRSDSTSARKGMTGRDLPPLRALLLRARAFVGRQSGARPRLRAERHRQDRVRRRVPHAARGARGCDPRAIARREHLPCAIVATIGTTSIASIDPVRAHRRDRRAREDLAPRRRRVRRLGRRSCPEYRRSGTASSTPTRSSSIRTSGSSRRSTAACSTRAGRTCCARRSRSCPEYLTTTDTAEINYMDYGLQLGRRFRALKLWMVMEHYGLERMRDVIREPRRLRRAARRGAAEARRRRAARAAVAERGRLPQEVGRRGRRCALHRAHERQRQALRLAHEARAARYGIRVAIGNGATEWRHVEQILSFL